MPLTERQQFVIRQSLPPTAALLGTAVAQLYWCPCESGSRTSAGPGKPRTGSSWRSAGLAGAVGVVHYLSSGVLVLRMWELDGMQVVFEFEAYEAMEYRRQQPLFHCFQATRDVMFGLCFAHGENADRVFAKVTANVPRPPVVPVVAIDPKGQSVGGWFKHVLGMDGEEGGHKHGKKKKKKKKKGQQARLSIGEPTDAKITGHAFRGAHGSVHLSDLTPEWREMLQAAGVTDDDLRDRSTADVVQDIIEGSQEDADAAVEALASMRGGAAVDSDDWDVVTRVDLSEAGWVVQANPVCQALQHSARAAAESDAAFDDQGASGASGSPGTGAGVTSQQGVPVDTPSSLLGQPLGTPDVGDATRQDDEAATPPPSSPFPTEVPSVLDVGAAVHTIMEGSEEDSDDTEGNVSGAIAATDATPAWSVPEPAPASVPPPPPPAVHQVPPPPPAATVKPPPPPAVQQPNTVGVGAEEAVATPAPVPREVVPPINVPAPAPAPAPAAALSPAPAALAAGVRSPGTSSADGSNDDDDEVDDQRRPRLKKERSFTRRASLFLRSKMGFGGRTSLRKLSLDGDSAGSASPTSPRPGDDAGGAGAGASTPAAVDGAAGHGEAGAADAETTPEPVAAPAPDPTPAPAPAATPAPARPKPIMKMPNFLNQLKSGKQALHKAKVKRRPPVSRGGRNRRMSRQQRKSIVIRLQRTMAARRRVMAPRSDSDTSDSDDSSD